MSKIIDTFLFFQELDLLEIRLRYLYPHVDYFVIVEADVTFSGKDKPYNFEKNIHRYNNFLDKIVYFKISKNVRSWDEIKKYLDGFSIDGEKIKEFLESHTHYDKRKIYWRLESFQRECIRIPLSKLTQNEDVVLLSDLDEIPHFDIVKNLRENAEIKQEILLHHEFKYKLNLHYPKLWKGTIISKWSELEQYSFNTLRQKAQSGDMELSTKYNHLKGYHFTSVGTYEEIKSKIESWGHQEFNNSLVKMNLQKNIEAGADIFARENHLKLDIVSASDSNFYDHKMIDILHNYIHLLQILELKDNSKTRYFITKLYNKVSKLLFRK